MIAEELMQFWTVNLVMTETIQTRFFTKFKANIFISIKSEVFEAFVEKRESDFKF